MSPKKTSHAQSFAALARAMHDAKAPWAVVAIIALVLLLSACAVDTARVERARDDLRTLCGGAMTSALRTRCASLGIDTTSKME